MMSLELDSLVYSSFAPFAMKQKFTKFLKKSKNKFLFDEFNPSVSHFEIVYNEKHNAKLVFAKVYSARFIGSEIVFIAHRGTQFDSFVNWKNNLKALTQRSFYAATVHTGF